MKTIDCRLCNQPIKSQQTEDDLENEYFICLNCRQYNISYTAVCRDTRLLQEDVKYEKYTLQFNHQRGQTYFSNVLRGGNMHIFPLILVGITYANLADKLKLYNLLYDIGQTPPFKETNFQNQLENFLKRHKKIDAFL